MHLEFTPFTAGHFSEYKLWYEDADLNHHLGPIDEAWLQAVLNDADGCEYAVFDGNEIIAVVGIKYPDDLHPFYFITDFAMKPHLRSQGIGSIVLKQLLQLYPLKPGQYWRAVVDADNIRAKTFFEKNGWSCLSETPDESGMLTLGCRNDMVGREGPFLD